VEAKICNRTGHDDGVEFLAIDMHLASFAIGD
jgi:hypothetical protein